MSPGCRTAAPASVEIGETASLNVGTGQHVPEFLTYDALMIPPFDEHGYLPPGIHPATLDEVEACFGAESELRRVQMESLRWLVDLARRAGVLRLIP